MEYRWKLTAYSVTSKGGYCHKTKIYCFDDKPTADRFAKDLIETDQAKLVIGPERIST